MTKVIKSLIQRLYPYGIFRAGRVSHTHDRRPVVYLTFDDGPIPEVTPKVLAVLEKYRVKATFFMVGENIDKHPEVFEQVVRAGHSVGNHTYNHLKGWCISYRDYMANAEKCQEAIENKFSIFNFQFSTSNLFRPPYGKATLRQRVALHKRGYQIIYWDILTKDYDASVTPQMMMEKIRRQVRPGSIINFHDSLKSYDRMLDVLPKAIEYLLSQGYILTSL